MARGEAGAVAKLRLKPPRVMLPLPRKGGEGWGEGQVARRFTLTLTLSLKGEGKTWFNRYDVTLRRCLGEGQLDAGTDGARQAGRPYGQPDDVVLAAEQILDRHKGVQAAGDPPAAERVEHGRAAQR